METSFFSEQDKPFDSLLVGDVIARVVFPVFATFPLPFCLLEPASEHARLLLSAKMRYVAAYLLSALGGKDSPSTGDIKKILDSVGIEADDTRMSKVVSELNGKNLEEVIAQGFSKLASVPSGGAVAASSAAAPSAGGSAAAAPAAEEKKEEKKEESEESEDDMGFGLFD
ncbi:hypothetical protein Q8A67_001783 [Cirrhinus molitorella]|uniref:Large ribosomal subunit protein P2 n=1 Tax=Cirrhinus molitorella TaxID=172907 RepID=A0AA88QJ84_9TELE|nr:hypothetical protein Q8A67_001783 [Cirrhinus molitorella]